MGISDYIAKKKAAFFQAQSTDKLELQKTELMKQRTELAAREKLRQEIRNEKREIRQLKTAPVREKFAAFRAAGKRANTAISKFGEGGKNPFANESSSGNLFGGSSAGPFAQSQSRNPFAPDTPNAPAKKSTGKTITIHVKE